VLTALQEKLAEAHGLAIAAAALTAKVAQRVDDERLRGELRALEDDARALRARCIEAENAFGEEAAEEMLAHASSTGDKAADMAAAWLRAGTGPLAAWTLLAMGEAGEVATWRAVGALAEAGGFDPVAELSAWALPVQERHLRVALDGAARLAALTDPSAPRWG
jgi:hypothetical protein